MAHVSIISSQSGEQIFEGAPRYIGAYLKPGYLEFPAIGSPTAISWHVGDYVVYPRTGKTYRLYRTPQIAEQGDTMRYGAAFLYENVQFFDDSKRLELCPFTDLVPGDNTVHFSTQNVVSFFGKPLNVAERLQACLEAQYGAGTWAVRIVTTTDADLLELLDTEVEFSVSGANCQQALDKVYELWNGLGWIHTVENGVNVITIGASNVRTNANTTVPFAYDDGLVRVERSIANADEIGTRLFAYGSMKNMDATYYRGLNIYHADSVDIEHLMIPLSEWGLTDGQPDARKAFIEDAAAVAKLGLIPKTAYFDGTGDLPDIHPTIERMTIGEVYDAGGAGYLPNLSKWSRDQRIDEVVSAANPEDHGTSAERGQKYTEDISSHLASLTDTFINNDTVSWTIFTASTIHAGRLTLNFGQEPQPITLTTAWTPQLDLKLAIYAGGKRVEAPLTIRQTSQTAWQIVLPESVTVSGAAAGSVEARIEGVITNTAGGQTTVEGSFSTNTSTAVTGGVEYELPKTFTVTIPQIGFDIEKYAALGEGKTISMKTGMCAGRDFETKSVKYLSSTDSWELTLYRSVDEDLNIMFPNADYEIEARDQFVLLDIAMPDMYVTVASQRLLSAAQKLLADISTEKPFFAPQIDAKVVYNENRVLLEGMWMDVTFDAAREYVLIDSITIDENGSNIPTYEISLRERKGIEWTENIGKSASSKSSVSVNGGEQEQTGSVSSVGMTVPTGLTVQGSPITSAGILKVGLQEGYKIPLISELAGYFEVNPNNAKRIDLKSTYDYLGPRKGIIFDANAEADTNADFEKVALPGGGYALHSKLPFYSDSFISAGGLSSGGGAAAGNATLVAQTYGGTLSATGIEGINFYSKERVDQLLLTAGTVQTVAGVSPTDGDIPVASLKSALGLGAAAAYGVGSVASGNTGLVTGGSVYSAINEAVSSVMKMQGTTTTPLSDGSTTNPVVIDGSSYTAKKGDVVLYDGKEYLWAGSAWEQLGDEASWALKTTSISAGAGLEGGGTLASNRTISLSAASIASLALADSAYQKPSTGIPQTDLESALSTKIDHGESAYTNLNDWFGIDDDGNIYVKKNGNTARGFYSYGFISAGGLSDGGGSGGIDPTAMWRLLGDSTNEQIAASHLTTALNGYATQSWVTGRGYITGITSSMVTNALGYTPVAPSALADYVTLATSQIITGDKIFDSANLSVPAGSLYISNYGNDTIDQWINFYDASGKNAQIGIRRAIDTYGPTYHYKYGSIEYYYKFWHEGNFTPSDYLTTVSAASTYAKLRTYNDLTFASDEFTFAQAAHSGALWFNARTASGAFDGAITYYRMGNGAASYAGVMASGYYLASNADNSYVLTAGGGSAAISGLSVSSAATLTTSRSIWGQSFNGSADVTGAQSNVTNIDSILYFDTTNSRIGIGNSSPGFTLDVAGHVSSSYGFVTAGSSFLTVFSPGYGTYNRLSFAVFGTDRVELEFPKASDDGGAANLPVYFGWRGGYYPLQLLSSGTVNINAGNSNGAVIGTITFKGGNEIACFSGDKKIWLNYDSTGDISMCNGGGCVGIGKTSPTYKLDVSGDIVASGAITAGSASDARLKTNIQTLSAEAAKRIVMALNPVTFTWNSTATELYDQYKGNDLGFIAQEVEPYLPQAIGTIFEKYMRLDQTKVIAPLVAVAQDHETRIRQLERENAELKRRLNMN